MCAVALIQSSREQPAVTEQPASSMKPEENTGDNATQQAGATPSRWGQQNPAQE